MRTRALKALSLQDGSDGQVDDGAPLTTGTKAESSQKMRTWNGRLPDVATVLGSDDEFEFWFGRR